MKRVPPSPYDPIAIQAMEYILDNGDATASEMEAYATWSPLNERMKKLCADGLVDFYFPEKGRKTVHYVLTPKGRVFMKMVKLSHEIYYGRIDIENGEIEEKIEDLLRWSSE
jgi:DNA-binding MarR family transcriptional regulator